MLLLSFPKKSKVDDESIDWLHVYLLHDATAAVNTAMVGRHQH